MRQTSAKQHAITPCSTRRVDNQRLWRPINQQVPWCTGLVAAVAALALTVSGAVAAEDLTISFKASRNPEIRKVQKSLVEAWGVYQDMICMSEIPCPIHNKTWRERAKSDDNDLLQLRLCGNTVYGTRI